MTVTTAGNGAVLPPGSAPTTPITETEFTLTVDAVNTELVEIPEARVVYPDGYTKFHQFTGTADLVAKVGNVLRNKYGVTGFTVAAVPSEIEPGAAIELTEVAYGV